MLLIKKEANLCLLGGPIRKVKYGAGSRSAYAFYVLFMPLQSHSIQGNIIYQK
jgi:hypothetical protein